MAVLRNPQWFAQAMLKLPNSNVDVLDPAGTLISIRYETSMSSILPHPDWLASAMVKLSCTKKSNVGDQYPLPPKVQKATIEYDFVAVAKRMDMLSVCTLQRSNAIVLDSGLDSGSRLSNGVINEVIDYAPTPLLHLALKKPQNLYCPSPR